MAVTARVGRRVSPHPRARLRRIVVGGVVAPLAAVLWLLFLAPRALGGPTTFVWVYGESMEPTLSTGDLVVVYSRDRYEVGDIVAFDLPQGGTVIHRIIERGPDGYRFQGDNRGSADPWALDETAIRGRQVVAIPGFADAVAKLRRPEYAAGLAAATVVVIGLRKP